MKEIGDQVPGPEDSPHWKDIAPEVSTPVNLTCRVCKGIITFWHCADSGCPYCAFCGANSKKPE